QAGHLLRFHLTGFILNCQENIDQADQTTPAQRAQFLKNFAMELVDSIASKNDDLHRSDCHGYLPLLTIMSMTTVIARISRSSSPWTTSTTYWSRPIQENCLEIFATCRPPRSISYWAQNTLP